MGKKLDSFPFYVNFKGLKTGMCISDKILKRDGNGNVGQLYMDFSV